METTIQTTLTPLELIALKSITHSDYYECGRDSIVWDFSVYDDCPLKGKTRSGVFSSLSQKGIVIITEKLKKYYTDKDGIKRINRYYSKDDYGTLKITELGYQLLDAKGLIDEYGSFLKS